MLSIKKYVCVLNMGLVNAMEYRVDFLLSLISTVFPMVIQLYLWSAIYGNSTDISNGYTYQQIIIYTLMAGITSKLVGTGFEYEINSDIKDGGLNKYIIKPVNYFLYRLFSFFGGKIPAIGILSVVMIVMLTVASIVMQITISPIRILVYVVSLFFALLLNFAIYFSVAMLGFWITEISRLFGTISIVLVVISGGVFPLDIFGNVVRAITKYLPFRYTTQFPVDILNGKLLYKDVIVGFELQMGWIIIFLMIACLLWKNGMKRYVAIGG